MANRICSVSGCLDPHSSKGFCERHYARFRRTGSPTGSSLRTSAERFWPKVERTDTCWVWTASKDSKGYGTFRKTRGATVSAHRFAYEEAIGEIPDGLEIDHLCFNRACVNPRHLEAVTHAENVRRSDHTKNHRNTRKTHCKYGHPFAGSNLRMTRSGVRRCRACESRRATEAWARHKAAKRAS